MRARMTRDARTALRQAGFSRRSFLKGSGALIVSSPMQQLSSPVALLNLIRTDSPICPR